MCSTLCVAYNSSFELDRDAILGEVVLVEMNGKAQVQQCADKVSHNLHF